MNNPDDSQPRFWRDAALPFLEARAVADRLRAVVAATPVPLPRRDGALEVTVSIGLALGGLGAEGPDDLLARADAALLASKAEGRNMVTFHPHRVA